MAAEAPACVVAGQRALTYPVTERASRPDSYLQVAHSALPRAAASTCRFLLRVGELSGCAAVIYTRSQMFVL